MLKFPRAFYPNIRPETGGGTSGPAYLDSAVASTCCDLDATIAASYPGSGALWANLTAAPADGAAQSAYDFNNNGFIFTGTAGDPAASWAADGSNRFDLASGVNTALINSLPKGAQDFWFALTFYTDNQTSHRRLFHTGPAFQDSTLGLLINSGEYIVLFQRGGASTRSSTPFVVTPALGAANILIISFQASTGTLRFWMNETEVTHEQVFSMYATTANPPPFTIGAESDGGLPMVSGEHLYSFAMGNEFLDNAKAAAIITHLEARHGRDYTP